MWWYSLCAFFLAILDSFLLKLQLLKSKRNKTNVAVSRQTTKSSTSMAFVIYDANYGTTNVGDIIENNDSLPLINRG